MSARHRPGGRFSRRIEPFWLNPATIKGTVAIVAGLFLLAFPELDRILVRVSLGIALMIVGATDLWFGIRRSVPGRFRQIAEGIAALGIGVLTLLYPAATLRALAVIGAVYLAIRGIAAIAAALSSRRNGLPWAIDISRGVLFFSLAAVLLVMPEGVVLTAVAVGAAAAVIVGAIILGYGIRRRSEDELFDVDVASVSELVNEWLHERDIGHDRRTKIGDRFFFEEPERNEKLISWWVMLLSSVAIATFGIIQDSTAVVIGAMLIAPLMTPILGVGAGIVNAWQTRVISSALLVLAGAAAAIGLAFVIGQWFPIIVPLAQNSQVISRVNPNLIDMMIALAAGAAGAYANVDERVSDSIAGVAIAVALVPPLGVVGLTLQEGMFEDSMGALLLFLTNLVSIILAATAVFLLTGYAPYRSLRENRSQVTALLRTVALAAVVILIPLTLAADTVVTGTARQAIANESVAEWVDGYDLTATNIEVNGSDVAVLITGADDPPPLDSLEQSLSDGFGEAVSLRVEYAPTMVYVYPDQD